MENEKKIPVSNEELIKAIAGHKSGLQISDYLGITFYQIAIQAKQKSNYNHVAHDVDMIADAVLTCHEKIESFDSKKSNNPHAYFMKICMGSFHDTVRDNTKHNYKIAGAMDELGISTSSSEEFLVDYLERHPKKTYLLAEGRRAGESYNWIHEDGRTFSGIIMELVAEYRKENLDKSSLSKVAKGKRSHYKGWRLV